MFPDQSPNVEPEASSSCEKQLQQDALWRVSGQMRKAEASIRLTRTDSKWTRSEPLNTQRWENEGVPMIADRDATITPSFVPLAPMNAPRHVSSLQWSEKYVIEPLQQGHGILREEMTGKGKHRE